MGVLKYLDELTPKQRDTFCTSFGQTVDLKDVLSTLQREHNKVGDQKRAAFIRKMELLSQPLQQFSAAIDVISQAQAAFSFVWGPLKAVILAS